MAGRKVCGLMDNKFETFIKKKEYLICIDSDGCAMDTMDIKHFNCFGPSFISEWKLEKWREELQTRWNEINLYTMTRGVNRFKGLAMILEEVNRKYTPIEDIKAFTDWAEKSKELSNNSLKEAIEKTDSEILKKVLSWSEAVNKGVNELSDDEKLPYKGAKEGISAAHELADIAIVSSANLQAVLEEWELNKLLGHTDVVLAQDSGNKAYCISKLLEKGYDKSKVLMVGDAPGDREAADKNEVLFYPILVKKEKESWEGFLKEGLSKFIEGTFGQEYQQKLIQEFKENLS